MKRIGKTTLDECEKLDRAYAEAHEFDEKQRRKWIEENFVLFCKRTDYPKLGYIIQRLNDEGIPCLMEGRSFHADHCLYVFKPYEKEAWNVLDEKRGRYRLDDVRDDHPSFLPYQDVEPAPIEDGWGE